MAAEVAPELHDIGDGVLVGQVLSGEVPYETLDPAQQREFFAYARDRNLLTAAQLIAIAPEQADVASVTDEIVQAKEAREAGTARLRERLDYDASRADYRQAYPSPSPVLGMNSPTQRVEGDVQAALDDAVRLIKGDAHSGAGAGGVTVESEREFKDWLIEFLPEGFSDFMRVPELGSVLRQLWRDKITDPSRISGAIMGTEWYQNNSAQAREWQGTITLDPASARQMIQSRAANIMLRVQSSGGRISAAEALQVAQQSYEAGWSEDTVSLFAGSKASNTINPAQVQAYTYAVKKKAGDWFVPMTDQAAASMARKMAAGKMPEGAIDDWMMKAAKSRFPHLSDIIDQGISPGEYFSPYQQAIANVMEISPDAVNLLDDPKWMKITGVSDGKTIRPMTISEALNYARELPEYRKTRDANSRGAELTEFLAEQFGKVSV